MTPPRISLQKLLGKEDRFFELFERSAEAARDSVQALCGFFQAPLEARTLDECVTVRRAAKGITVQINELLCATFVSAMESADIEALSNALYKIPKTMEKIAERVQVAPHLLDQVDLSSQLGLLEKAGETLVGMVKDFRKSAPVPVIRGHNEQLQSIEGEADKLVVALLRSLYSGEQGAARIVFQKDLFELLEKGTDRFRDAGNIILQVALKSV